jgi:hypothetical protein
LSSHPWESGAGTQWATKDWIPALLLYVHSSKKNLLHREDCFLWDGWLDGWMNEGMNEWMNEYYHQQVFWKARCTVQESESILEPTLLKRLLLAERINSALLKEFLGKYSALPMVFSNYFLYAFFWVLPRHLNFICWRFGTHCSIFIGLWRWNRQRVPKHQHIKFRHRGITQKKAYNI